MPAEVADPRIVGVAIVVREVAQRTRLRRTDDASVRPAPHDRYLNMRNDRLIRIGRLIVPERLYISKILSVAGIGRDDFGFARYPVVRAQIRTAQLHGPLDQL